VNRANFFGIGRADLAEPLGQGGEGLLPLDFLEFAGTAIGAGLALERLQQARRGVLLHDPRRTLGADHALVQRVVGLPSM
jgi:hypothetical protein